MNDRSRYVQFGAGRCGPPTWRNFDSNPRLRLQRLPFVGTVLHWKGKERFPDTIEYGDIVKGLPVPDGHCRAVYGSHVLEHMTREECRIALDHTYHYLATGGLFRLVVPDLEAIARAYLQHEAPDAAHQFMMRTALGQERPRPALLKAFDPFRNAHLWMWDYGAMRAELEQAGFVDVRRAQFGDSSEGRFEDVETRSRFEEPGFGGAGTLPCLAIECRKA